MSKRSLKKVIIIKTVKLCNLRLHIHFLFIFSFFALCIANKGYYPLIVLACAVFHELGHVLTIVLCGGKISDLYLLPFGAEIRYGKSLSYKKDFLIAFSGPFFNILLALILLVCYTRMKSIYIVFALFCNLFLSLLNLFPLCSFDGGRMLEIIYLCLLPYEKALKFKRISELISLVLLSFFSVCAIIFCGYNLSLIFICAYIFVSCYTEKDSYGLLP